MTKRQVTLLSLVAVSCIGTLTFTVLSVLNLGFFEKRHKKVQIVAQETAIENARRHARVLAQFIGLDRPLLTVDVGPSPCGSDEELEHLPNGSYNPYQIILSASMTDVHSAQLESTIDRLRDHYQNSGWKITEFKPPGADGRPVIEVSAANPADGYGVNVEAIENNQVLAVTVGSPCYKHPANETAQ